MTETLCLRLLSSVCLILDGERFPRWRKLLANLADLLPRQLEIKAVDRVIIK